MDVYTCNARKIITIYF